MPNHYASIFQGCFRVTMSLKPSPFQFHIRPYHKLPVMFKHLPFTPTGTHVSPGGSLYLRSVVACSASSGACARSPEVDWWQRNVPLPYLFHQNSRYGGFSFDDLSEYDSDLELGSAQQQQMCVSTNENFDEWKGKLKMLIHDKDELEVVSREKKDIRDFEQLSALATTMGLYCQQYSRVIVFSKVPLPNYRSDLDDRHPWREVVLPFGLEKEVDAHLKEYLSQKSMCRDSFSDKTLSSSVSNSIVSKEGFYEKQDPLTETSIVMEQILKRRSLRMRNQRQDWQDSPEGQKMQEFRRSLPAYKEREALINAISQNQVVVVSGETGCGKTTQLPQYILESEIEAARGAFCSIICTQPRQISAISVSERVAAERGEKLGESVGYKVRLEGTKGKDNHLLFCSTGVLLRRLLVDRNLNGVSHVIVDEIHERGMNEDILLIVLKDLLPRRPELRLILMSATLNADLFSSYFGGAPTIHIPGFTYPVQTHFLENILEMTGYRLNPFNQMDDYGEEKVWKMQKQVLRKRKSQIASSVEDAFEVANFDLYSRSTQESLSYWNPDSMGFNLIEHVLCHIVKKERPGAVLVFMTGWNDINSLKDKLQTHPLLGDPRKVLLLACHGSMASSEQRLIFDKPEDGVRKIVLATNMAETSITINDVVFVVDCGKAKETSYDALNNTTCLLPSWISKAAARQRRGRAGRVQPGECYHLYPKCLYDAFPDYQLPELVRSPLHSVCLQIKSLHPGSISDFLSRALQPPESLSVQNAIEYLKTIEAFDDNEDLTVLGRYLSMLPVEPKLGKMIIFGAVFNCLDPILTIVASLSVRDPFVVPFEKKDVAESAKALFAGRTFSDHFALVQAYEGWKEAERQQSGHTYCWRNFLSAQTLKAIDSLRSQFFHLLKDACMVQNKTEECNNKSNDEHLVRAVICAGLFPGICSVVNKEKSISLKSKEDGQVLLYSSSVNALEPKIPYPWLVFNGKMKVNAVFLRDSTAVSDSMLLLFGGKVSRGGIDGHLKMLGGYFEFFMKPGLAETYLSLRRELEELIQQKLLNPTLDIHTDNKLLTAVRLLVSEAGCSGRFAFPHQLPMSSKNQAMKETSPSALLRSGGDGEDDVKGRLQTVLVRAGHQVPHYNTLEVKNNLFQSNVIFKVVGQPCNSKKLAEKDAAAKALEWLLGEMVDHTSMLPQKTRKLERPSSTEDSERLALLYQKIQELDDTPSSIEGNDDTASSTNDVDRMALLYQKIQELEDGPLFSEDINDTPYSPQDIDPTSLVGERPSFTEGMSMLPEKTSKLERPSTCEGIDSLGLLYQKIDELKGKIVPVDDIPSSPGDFDDIPLGPEDIDDMPFPPEE